MAHGSTGGNCQAAAGVAVTDLGAQFFKLALAAIRRAVQPRCRYPSPQLASTAMSAARTASRSGAGMAR